MSPEQLHASTLQIPAATNQLAVPVMTSQPAPDIAVTIDERQPLISKSDAIVTIKTVSV